MSYLSDWAEKVMHRDSKCVICGSKNSLEAHHVFKVNKYDDAYLDINNGITLCKGCHEMYHERYGLDCNLKNLLDLKRDMANPSYAKLKVKYDLVHNQMRNLEKKNRKLKTKNRKLRKRLNGK